MQQFECARCHDGSGVETPPLTKQCVGCHRAIQAGGLKLTDPTTGKVSSPTPAVLAEWQGHIVHLRHVPDLADLGETLRPEWLARFLANPHDLRPALPASMPRLPLSEEQARDVAAYLTRTAPRPVAGRVNAGDARRGAGVFASHGCGKCHAFGPAQRPEAASDPRFLAPDALLAPDLQFTRERFRTDRLDAWLEDPQRVRDGALMPKPKLTPAERRDVIAYLLEAELPKPARQALRAPLPLLTRPVTFDEVNQAVFRKVCWHCHAQPSFARGDGGPGMTGGFGFEPRRLDLSAYGAILAGYLDDAGETRSVFTPAAAFEGERDSHPMLLAVLLARQREELGFAASVRGMPLGLPALSPPQIQLVASWIDQGRPH
ncbi:MAG: c-type cytochrome [Myxococcales bacterium]|nr:c-type cytochrome [Myxococcales bacterium]